MYIYVYIYIGEAKGGIYNTCRGKKEQVAHTHWPLAYNTPTRTGPTYLHTNEKI